MKKTSIILICLIVFLLCGCRDTIYYYDYNELAESVEQIYIVEVQRTKYYGDISIKYLKKIEDEFDSFLNDLSKLEFVSSHFPPLHPQNNTGISVMLIYTNLEDDYGIIGCNGIEKFRNGKQTSLHNARCDFDTFNALINKYYDN